VDLPLTSVVSIAATAHESARHRSTAPYVLGAVVIAILAIALTVQLARMKRARARRGP
jgi:hypothetical protein